MCTGCRAAPPARAWRTSRRRSPGTRSSPLRARFELRPVVPTPLEEALPRLRSFVSPFGGVIRSLGETLAAPDEHRLISIGCQLAEADPTIGERLDSYTGSEHWRRAQAQSGAHG